MKLAMTPSANCHECGVLTKQTFHGRHCCVGCFVVALEAQRQSAREFSVGAAVNMAESWRRLEDLQAKLVKR